MLIWLSGLLRRRRGRLAAAGAGVGVAVALLATLGVFIGSARASMTTRAASTVIIDWQVHLAQGADPAAATSIVTAQPGVRAALPVGYAHVPALSATSANGVQTTAAAVVLGIPDRYRETFPTVMRTLAGADNGVLLAQQTAANLRAGPGTVVTVTRPGLPAAQVTVVGVVDLPHADTLFAPIGTGQPVTAPPDNVLLLPNSAFHTLLDPLAASRPDLVSNELHVRRDHVLPSNPADGFTAATGAAHHLDAALSGTGQVADNLGAALDAARADAAYATILFLFLALPGAVLAGLLTAVIVASGAVRRRAEQALLRTRGATRRRVLATTAVEAATIGVAGALLGLATAALLGWAGLAGSAAGGSPVAWFAVAGLAGLLVAAGAVLVPAWRDLRTASVVSGRAAVGRRRLPLWARLGLDVLALAGAALVFWATSAGSYQLVLAPEGVPQISIDYWAFTGPALLWAGAGMAAWRLTEWSLRRGRVPLGRALRPLAGALSDTVAASLVRQRRPIAAAVALLTLALTFAASTATFNTTYARQAEVDARLTNGADVTITEPPSGVVGPQSSAAIAGVNGVRHVEPLQHRFAYVGADLQDIYGVNPKTVTTGARLSDSYFTGGSAATLMRTLAAQPDGLLVSAETVADFQLSPGDQVNLRLNSARTGHLVTVAFHYVGVVKEFPTAPRDSFLVADAAYIAKVTGDTSVGAFLVDAGGSHTAAVAAAVRDRLGPTATVTDLSQTRGKVGSSLTAVDLSGLTRIELGFAFALAATAAGLVLALGLTERRRMFTIATTLGATRRHIAGFVVAEAAVILIPAFAFAAVTGWALSSMLVTVLHGVFDPPPDHLALPWLYLGAVLVATVAATASTVAALVTTTGTPRLTLLRHTTG